MPSRLPLPELRCLRIRALKIAACIVIHGVRLVSRDPGIATGPKECFQEKYLNISHVRTEMGTWEFTGDEWILNAAARNPVKGSPQHARMYASQILEEVNRLVYSW